MKKILVAWFSSLRYSVCRLAISVATFDLKGMVGVAQLG